MTRAGIGLYHESEGRQTTIEGRCVAAEYIKLGGLEAYQQFKQKLLGEINALLAAQGIDAIDGLFELIGEYVNLEYPMPGGGKVKLLNDKNIYLGAQIDCFGPNPQTLQSVNTRIFSDWLPGNPDYELSGNATVEWYDCVNGEMTDPDYHSAIWVPVKRKE